jgi:hypothetical protein
MPAPVDSRSSLTIWALISAILFILNPQRPGLSRPFTSLNLQMPQAAQSWQEARQNGRGSLGR